MYKVILIAWFALVAGIGSHFETAYAQVPPGVINVAWSPDGQYVAAAGKNALWFENRTTGAVTSLAAYSGIAVGLAWSPDSQRLATSGTDDAPDGQVNTAYGDLNVIRIWHVSGALLATFSDFYDLVQAVDWSPDGTQLVIATVGETDSVRVLDMTTYDPIPIVAWNVTYASNVAWSRDGARIAFGTPTGAFIVPSATPLSFSQLSDYAVGWRKQAFSIRWNPQSTRVAIGYRDRILVWDLLTWRQVWAITAHSGVVEGIAWSPRGDSIASISSQDHRVKIWDAATGAHVATYPNESRVASLGLAWHPNLNSSQLAYGGEPTTVLTFVQVPTDSLPTSPF
ncbi:MAG: WD40 repeat domain-containing protein [Chloroflexota bacterium]|nr:WD40 repeat domain-containing protein [Chloroflexota bacterium]